MLQVSTDCNNNYIVNTDYETVFYIEKPMKKYRCTYFSLSVLSILKFSAIFNNYDMHLVIYFEIYIFIYRFVL